MGRRSEKCIAKGSRYTHWIGLYLSFHLTWVLGPFVHDRLQNLKTSEDTFGHNITPLEVGCRSKFLAYQNQHVSKPSSVKLQCNERSRSALKSRLVNGQALKIGHFLPGLP